MSTRTSYVDDTWDVIVIGGGSAGENAAQYSIQGSQRTAVIVEHELVGGECSYWACMPSKALLRPVEVVDTGRALPGVAEKLEGSLDVAPVFARRDSFTHNHDDSGQVEWARNAGIDVVRGWGRLAGDKVVARIKRVPDPFIMGIVEGWPRNFDAKRAGTLGFTTAEKTFDDIIRIHIEDELGGKFVD